MGAGSMDHRHMAQIIKRRTGGLSVSPHVVSHHTEASTYNQVYSRTTGIARFFPQSPGQTRMSENSHQISLQFEPVQSQ
jgi:hypothetical protein